MYGKIIKYLISNPTKAIDVTKKKSNKNVALSITIVEWILFAIAAAILKPSAITDIGIFIAGIIFTLFTGLLVEIVYKTLGSKGGYIEGLSVISYALMPLSFGFLIASILFLGKLAGFVLGMAVLSIYGVMGVAALYYSAKTFFKTDMITSFVGISVLILGLTLMIYTSIIGLAVMKAGTLSSILPLMTHGGLSTIPTP